MSCSNLQSYKNFRVLNLSRFIDKNLKDFFIGQLIFKKFSLFGLSFFKNSGFNPLQKSNNVFLSYSKYNGFIFLEYINYLDIQVYTLVLNTKKSIFVL